MVRIMDFSDALTESGARGRGRSVLLGNGFSVAYSPAFGYSRLRDVAVMPGLSVPKDELFDHAGSSDFETVIDNLRHSADLVRLYGSGSKKFAKRMKADATLVKRGLVDAITHVHPHSAWTIPDSKYISARKFLSGFDGIFTLSYDLLLYWTLQQVHLSPVVARRDGFGPDGGTLKWTTAGARGQQVFYLHGAVHLHVLDRRVRKLTLSAGSNLLDQLQKNLALGRYPLVVTEGSRRDKESRIGRSRYLTNCLQQLRAVRGDLFVHGMAFSPNDGHILDAISDGASRIRSLYVGVFGGPSEARDEVELRAKALTRARRRNGGRKLTVHFYQSESAAPWG